MFNLRYYYTKCNYFYHVLKYNKNIKIPQDLNEKVQIKIEKLPHLERVFFSNIGSKNHYNIDYDFVKTNLNLPENKRLKNDVYFYAKAKSFLMEKSNIYKALFFLKKLKNNNSPFYYRLFNDVRECLKMRFAFTEIERAEHDKLFHIIENFDLFEIPFFDYEVNFKKENEYLFKDNNFNKNNENEVLLSSTIINILIIAFVLMILILLFFKPI